MFYFQQTPDTFHVEEVLLYPLSGSGDYTFVKVQKKGMSTAEVKRAISGTTGVPLKNIHHAGMKDRAATATQWLSWPTRMQRQAVGGHDNFEVVEQTTHETALRLGHVAANRFRLKVETDQPQQLEARLKTRIPNFYGPQRFGKTDPDPANAVARLGRVVKQKDAVSVIQSALFNAWLRQRLAQCGETPQSGDYWTGTNGKRCFQADYDDDLARRYLAGEISPSGPMFGYRVRLNQAETDWLAQWGLEPESFRPCGKSAKGARRPIFIQPRDIQLDTLEGNTRQLAFELPSGAYATVVLTHLVQPERLLEVTGQPDFLKGLRLD